jgi:hypothetical protein
VNVSGWLTLRSLGLAGRSMQGTSSFCCASAELVARSWRSETKISPKRSLPIASFFRRSYHSLDLGQLRPKGLYDNWGLQLPTDELLEVFTRVHPFEVMRKIIVPGPFLLMLRAASPKALVFLRLGFRSYAMHRLLMPFKIVDR